jgi:hypothetical protein
LFNSWLESQNEDVMEELKDIQATQAALEDTWQRINHIKERL